MLERPLEEAAEDDFNPRPRVAFVLAACAFVVFMFAAHQMGQTSGITGWIRVGANVADESQLPPGMYQEAGLGYDGKHYYRLARAPLSTDHVVDGMAFDRPAFRHQRIGYPAAAWLLSVGGRQGAVPWALVAVNAIALVGSAGALAQLAAQRGKSSWLGIAGAALPASVMAFHFDLAEALEACLLLWALVLLDRRRWGWATVVLGAAALTRETSLILAAALSATTALQFIRARLGTELARERPPWWVGVVPALLYGSWTMWISSLWDEPGESARRSAEHFSPDLLAIPKALADLPFRAGFDLAATSLFLGIGVLGVAALLVSKSPLYERLAFIGTTVIVLTYSGWDRAVVYLRHPGLWALFAIVVALSVPSDDRAPRLATVPCILTVVLAILVTTEIATMPFPPPPG